MKMMKLILAARNNDSPVLDEIYSLLPQLGVEASKLEGHREDFDYVTGTAALVSSGAADGGIVLGGTGLEGSLLGNKFRGVRAALVSTPTTAVYTREHNDSNLLCLGEDMIGREKIMDIVRNWVTSDFIGGRHAISVGMMSEGEAQQFRTNSACRIVKASRPVRHICIGNDHAGYEAKLNVLKLLDKHGITYTDLGTDSTDIVRYPYYSARVAHAVLDGSADAGITICGTGIGINIASNKFKGIRASLCNDVTSARIAREVFDTNVLCMGGKIIGYFELEDIVETWLNTPYKEENNNAVRRISEVEAKNMTETDWKPQNNV